MHSLSASKNERFLCVKQHEKFAVPQHISLKNKLASGLMLRLSSSLLHYANSSKLLLCSVDLAWFSRHWHCLNFLWFPQRWSLWSCYSSWFQTWITTDFQRAVIWKNNVCYLSHQCWNSAKNQIASFVLINQNEYVKTSFLSFSRICFLFLFKSQPVSCCHLAATNRFQP